MISSVILVSAISLYFGWSAVSTHQYESCLPEGLKLTDVISVRTVTAADGGATLKRITLNEKLIELKARCKKGKLVDRAGREIRFVKLAGCWGNPPVNYQEILARQEKEINELKKRCTVVEIPCNLSVNPRLIH